MSAPCALQPVLSTTAPTIFPLLCSPGKRAAEQTQQQLQLLFFYVSDAFPPAPVAVAADERVRARAQVGRGNQTLVSAAHLSFASVSVCAVCVLRIPSANVRMRTKNKKHEWLAAKESDAKGKRERAGAVV